MILMKFMKHMDIQMLNLLLKPLLGVASQAVTGFVETKKAKAQLKLTEVQAATKLKQDQIAGKVAWEASAVDQMKGSWKDGLILICLLGPAVLVFFPGMTAHIEAGFVALQQLPDYYKHLLYIACSASFGIKGAKGAMGLIKKKQLLFFKEQCIIRAMNDENAIYLILKNIRERKEELKNIIASGLHSFDEYNKTVGEYKGYNIMEQEIQDLQKDEDGDTET